MSTKAQSLEEEDDTITSEDEVNEEIASEEEEQESPKAKSKTAKSEVYKESNSFVQVSKITTDPNEIPQRELSDTDKEVIEGYNAREYQQELDKEKFAKVAYMVWQSKQLFWRAFRKIGETDDGRIEWEARDYKYHPITGDEAGVLDDLLGEYETLFNNWDLFKRGVVNDSLYRYIINREVPAGTELKRLESKILIQKFKAYFKEPNEGIIKQLLKVDRRDLVEAAEYRESGVPFSRRQGSSPTTSVSNTVVKQKKK